MDLAGCGGWLAAHYTNLSSLNTFNSLQYKHASFAPDLAQLRLAKTRVDEILVQLII